MKIYVDDKNHCHETNPDGNFREAEHPFFDGKCTVVIEGYCYDDSRGYVAIYPWKDSAELDNAQREYEKQLLATYEEALTTVGVVL